MTSYSIVDALKTAMPYIQDYRGRTFVVKLGGGVLADRDGMLNLADQIAFLGHLAVRVVVVHGGGPQATALQERLGIRTRIIAGRRVTDQETLRIAKMVFAGELNMDVLAAFRARGIEAVGITGLDAGLVEAHRRPPVAITDDDGVAREIDFGFVGDVAAERIRPRLLDVLSEAHYVPVLASLAADAHGNILNVNADVLAAEVAVALRAYKLIFLTEAAGLLRDPADPASLVPFADPQDIERLKASGNVKGGMKPKIDACVRAATHGVKRTHIINGLQRDSLLTELFTAEGCGTMVVAERESATLANGNAHE